MSPRTTGGEGSGTALRRRLPFPGHNERSIFAHDVFEPPGSSRDGGGRIAARNGSDHLDGGSQAFATTFADQNHRRPGGRACPFADVDTEGERIARAGCSDLENHAPCGGGSPGRRPGASEAQSAGAMRPRRSLTTGWLCRLASTALDCRLTAVLPSVLGSESGD